MNTKDFSEELLLERYVPLDAIAKIYGLTKGSLKQLLHLAKKKGVPMPDRKKVKRIYLYDRQAFSTWMWQHANALKGKFGLTKNESEA